jgi:predicted nucleic acid-binding protein
MEEKLIICDTDVLIDYFDATKPRHQITKNIIENQISLENIVISAITKMELLLGAATALVADFELFTYNIKDFRFIKKIRLFEFQ